MTVIPFLDKVILSLDEHKDLLRIQDELTQKLKQANNMINVQKNEMLKLKNGDITDYKLLISPENMRILRGCDINLLEPQTAASMAKALMPNSPLNIEKSKVIEAAKQAKSKTIFRGTPTDCVKLINEGKDVEALILLTNIINKKLKGRA